MLTPLPSTAGSEVKLLTQGAGRDRFYYYITPSGTTRSFRTARLARTFARRHGWVVK